MRLQIITASTREGRLGHHVAAWFAEQARAHGKFEIEEIDLAAVNLPLFDEPRHPRLGQYVRPHTLAWAETVARGDAYVFVTPEYNHGPPAALINALTFLAKEWNYKPVGFTSYGGASGGLRGVQVAKQIVTTLRMMPIPEGVSIPFFAQHLDEERGAFDPGEVQEKAAVTMLDELARWASALAQLRG